MTQAAPHQRLILVQREQQQRHREEIPVPVRDELPRRRRVLSERVAQHDDMHRVGEIPLHPTDAAEGPTEFQHRLCITLLRRPQEAPQIGARCRQRGVLGGEEPPRGEIRPVAWDADPSGPQQRAEFLEIGAVQTFMARRPGLGADRHRGAWLKFGQSLGQGFVIPGRPVQAPELVPDPGAARAPTAMQEDRRIGRGQQTGAVLRTRAGRRHRVIE
jgi:hypothetical protein